MHASYWEYLLRLMALIILVDKKVYQEEVEAFIKATMQLRDAISPNMMMTPKMAKDWFIVHRERIEEVVNSLNYDYELIEIIGHLRGLPQKTEVLKAMIAIALSDDFYHDKEKMIIKKTVLYWNIDPRELEES